MNIENFKTLVNNMDSNAPEESMKALIKGIILEHFNTDKFALFFYALNDDGFKRAIFDSRMNKLELLGLLEFEKNLIFGKKDEAPK